MTSEVASSLRILVIDDDETARRLGERMLQRLGHVAETAEDGAAGLGRVKFGPGAYDIAIVDLVMPGIDGRHIVEEIRRLQHGPQVVVVSGYPMQQALADWPQKSRPVFLQKPFTLDSLSRSLKAAISMPATSSP